MTVKELIVKLCELDPNMDLEISIHQSGGADGYYAGDESVSGIEVKASAATGNRYIVLESY
jgi:hypothetical protein